MKEQKIPMISVIMGIYNCASTLPEAIESVLNQTYQDFEFVMCDDGSTDDTFEIASQYAKKYPDKIVLVKNEKNMGLNYTLNHCLQVAKGKYIARMDGDDRSLPERLQMELEFLEGHPEYAVVGVALELFDDEGIWGQTKFKAEPQPADLVRRTCFSHAACMVRKAVYDEVGGYSEGKKLMRVEDKHLWYKIYAAGYKGRNLDQILYSYRDDRAGYAKRKLKYRFNSFYVSTFSIKTFHLPFYFYFYAARPILIGLLPYPIYKRLHKRKMTKNS